MSGSVTSGTHCINSGKFVGPSEQPQASRTVFLLNEIS